MQILSILLDNRIKAFNVLIELTIGEYLDFAVNIVDANEFQRRKVIKAKVREIFKEDLQMGCLFPSIVLAVYGEQIGDEAIKNIDSNAEHIVTDAAGSKKMLIIDGLQRTFVMLALREELQVKPNHSQLNDFLGLKMRAEVYIGLKRMGLLYRMITLNTGQTTMSTRHLMEILFLDYSTVEIEGVRLIKDKDESSIAANTSEYNFKDILDGFNSMIEKDEGIIDRSEILDNIRVLDILKNEVNLEEDLFKEYVSAYKAFLDTLIDRSNNWRLDIENLEYAGIKLNLKPFGNSVIEIFKKSQAITGFGASIGILKELKNTSLSTVKQMTTSLTTTSHDWNTAFSTILAHLDIIANRSKKIGNDQRFYFKIFFRNLFNEDTDQYLNVLKAAENASSRTRETWEERKS